jgi:hypothetical protein
MVEVHICTLLKLQLVTEHIQILYIYTFYDKLTICCTQKAEMKSASIVQIEMDCLGYKKE